MDNYFLAGEGFHSVD